MDLSYVAALFNQIKPFLYFVLSIIATWLVSRVVGSAVQRIMRYSPHLLVAYVRRVVSIIIWFLGVSISIEQLGLGIEILVSLIVITGVGMLIALRDVLSNIASKYFSDIYVPFKKGDVIRVGEYGGTVVEINPIVTVLLSNDDKLISIPNQVFIREIVVNETQEAWKEIQVPILLDTNIDLAEFESEVLRRISKLRHRFDERFPPTLVTRRRVNNQVELALVLKVRDPGMRDEVVSEINKRIGEAIDHLRRGKPRFNDKGDGRG